MSNEHSARSDEVERDPTLRIPVGSEEVAATRYSPTDRDGPLPALLMYIPYPKDDVITFGAYAPLVRYLATHGYEVVVANMVGTGASTGHIQEMFTRQEPRESVAIIEWLADREWTTGRVGMFGKSYGGITALDAAAKQPESLDAIVPIHTPYEGYRNAYTHNGTFELLNIGINWLTLMQALEAKPPSRRDDDAGWAAWRDRIDKARERGPRLFDFLDHRPGDEYWTNKNIPIEQIETPTLAVGGFRDSYTGDTLAYFDAVDAPKRLLLGPWRHTMPHRGREARIDFRRQAVDWFDRFLKDRDVDVGPDGAIQYWTETDGGGKVDGGVWRERRDWPQLDDDARDVTLAVSPAGLVDAETYENGTLEREYEFDHTVGANSVPGGNGGIGPTDTTPDDHRSLVAETAPLASPLELTGTGHVTVRLDSTADSHRIAARLVDVHPDGRGHLITDGTVPVDQSSPNEEDAVTVPLQPASHVVDEGHRLRLSLAASFFPMTDPSDDHGSMTVRSTPDAPTALLFPGGYRDTLPFDDAIEMAAPDGSRPTTTSFHRNGSSNWAVTREHTDDSVEVRKEQEAAFDLPHAETMHRRFESTAAVDARDPRSLSVSNRLELVIDYGDETVRVVAQNRIGKSVTSAETRVSVGDTTVFDERWVR